MSKAVSALHHRRSIRLKGYDYSRPGAYFVTICTHNLECLFGEVVDGRMGENGYGRLVRDEWMKTAGIRREIELREFVIMPNHIHGIVIINAQPVGAYGNTPYSHTPHGNAPHGNAPHGHTPHDNPFHDHAPMSSPSKTLGAMVRGFKSAVTKQINIIRTTSGTPVWQRNYFEHIIRDDTDYNRIAEYIAANPRRWINDQLHPGYKPKQSDITDAEASGFDVVDDGKTNVGVYGAGTDFVGAYDIGADVVGAYGHTPLRNVDNPGGRDE